MIYQRWMAYVAEAVLVAAVLGGLWAHGYGKGKAAKEADMAALRAAYAVAEAQAKGRADTALKAAQAATAKAREDYDRDTKELAARAAAAQSAYARILSEYAASVRRSVPAAAGPAGGVEPAPSGDELERARGAAEGIARVARSCAEDGARLAALQRYYESLRAVY